MGLVQAVKNILKYILPPPVRTFLREITGLRQLIVEQSGGLRKLIMEQNADLRKLALEGFQSSQAEVQSINAEMQSIKEAHQDLKRQMDGQIALLTKKLNEQTAQYNADKEHFQAKLDEISKLQKKAMEPAPIKYDYDYYKSLPPQRYKEELEQWYERRMKAPLDLEHPKTFNEKIQWLKLYDSTPLKTRLADKYLVREWVREKIGEEYLIPLLGVWDRFDEIDFDQLPDQFVLKANHGSGWNIIVKDKSKLDLNAAQEKFRYWMGRNFAFICGLELHYMNIPPKIIAEEYIESKDDDLNDYKIFCFNGRAESIAVMSERQKSLKMSFYDLNWNKLPFTYGHPAYEEDIPKPQNLDLLVRLAEQLAKGFPLVRVDFYILDDGQIKFGEMTFTPVSGGKKWNPPYQDRVYGDLIQLPEKSPVVFYC